MAHDGQRTKLLQFAQNMIRPPKEGAPGMARRTAWPGHDEPGLQGLQVGMGLHRIGNPLTWIVHPKPRTPREAFLDAKDPGRVEQLQYNNTGMARCILATPHQLAIRIPPWRYTLGV